MKKRTSFFWKIFKQTFVFVGRTFYISMISLMVFLLTVSRPDFMSGQIERVLKAKLPQGMSLSGLSYRVSPSFKGAVIRQARFTLKKEKAVYEVYAETVIVPDVVRLLFGTSGNVFIQGVDLESENLKMTGFEGDIVLSLGSKEDLAAGSVVADGVRYKDYELSHLFSDVRMTAEAVFFDRLLARAYHGRITAEGSYHFFPKERIEVRLDFRDVDTSMIKTVGSKWKGVAQGRAQYAGTVQRIENLQIELQSPSSEMERTLFKYLMGDVGGNLAFLPFSKALESIDFIHLDNFHGTVHNLDEESVSVKLNLDSRQLNLRLNPDITIRLR